MLSYDEICDSEEQDRLHREYIKQKTQRSTEYGVRRRRRVTNFLDGLHKHTSCSDGEICSDLCYTPVFRSFSEPPRYRKCISYIRSEQRTQYTWPPRNNHQSLQNLVDSQLHFRDLEKALTKALNASKLSLIDINRKAAVTLANHTKSSELPRSVVAPSTQQSSHWIDDGVFDMSLF